MNESVEDVLDLFPEDGDMFSANENEKKSTPNKSEKPENLYTPHFSPIEFGSLNPDYNERIRDPLNITTKLGVGIVKRAVSSRLGEFIYIYLHTYTYSVYIYIYY